MEDIEIIDVEMCQNNLEWIFNGRWYVFSFVEELSGIFVRSIAEGSAAALDGRIQVNDQIIEVSDGEI